MYFESVKNLFYMDGHGVFVWACYLMAVVVFSGFILQTFLKSKKTLLDIQAGQREVLTEKRES